MSEMDEAADSAARYFDKQGIQYFRLPGEDLPQFLVCHKTKGLVALEFVPKWDPNYSEKDRLQAYFPAFKKKLRNLGRELPSLPDEVEIRPKLLLLQKKSENSSGALSVAISLDWLNDMQDNPIDDEVESMVERRFPKAFTFVARAREVGADANLEIRDKRAFILSPQQQEIAASPLTQVGVLTGPAGSGKSLVLAAKAKLMAANNPKWRIQILCFNRGLVPYLKGLVRGNHQISVDYFHSFVSGRPFQARSSASNHGSMQEFTSLRTRGIYPEFEALLVDEFQDFKPGWLAYCLALVKPDSGGLFLAGDVKQALYIDTSIEMAFSGKKIESFHLSRPYRATRQILEVIGKLDKNLEVEGVSEALDGADVDLVWVQNRTQLSAAIHADIKTLMQEIKGLRYSDIAVLVTQYHYLQAADGISKTLERFGIPSQTTWRKQGLDLDLRADTVKLLTVHTAKGIEFKVVLMVGLDEIESDADEDGDLETFSEMQNHRPNLVLVGPSRARDRLIIYYRKTNSNIAALAALSEGTRHLVYPDDYPTES